MKFLHIMLNAETLQETARTELVAVQINRETRRSCPVPDVVIDSCEELFELSSYGLK